MQVQLKKPELEKFIAEQVKAGHFPNPEAAIEAAVQQMMLDQMYELDGETIDAVNRAEDQIDRGQGVNFKQFAAELRKKMAAG